jgi:peptidyl-prolyl cis-trans isomerase SurA
MLAAPVLLALALLLGAALPGAAAEQRIAAIVNDSVVSVQDLNQRLGLVLLTGQIRDSERARQRLAPQVLRGLIEETLQRQEAERLGISVNQQELDQALANIAERNKMSIEQMERVFQENGVDPETLFEQLRAQIAWIKVVNRQIRPRINVSVDQLEVAVQEARKNQGQAEYLLSEIVLPVDNPAQERTVAQDAQRLVQTLAEGASFEALARQVSASTTAARGGDVGWIPASSIPPELVEALERLRPGDVSEPLRTPVGFYIFQLRDRRLVQAPGEAPEDGREVRMSQILFEAPSDDEAALAQRIDQAAALRDRLTDCASMNQVATELETPASGDLGWLKVGELPAVLGSAVAELGLEEVSQPLQGPAGIHLLMVCEQKGEPGTISSEEQAGIEQRLEQERLDRLARRYLRDLRKQAFVDVRL